MLVKLPPHVCLDHVIDYYWIEKNNVGSVKVLPDGTTSILFNLGESLGVANDKTEKQHLTHDLIIGAHKKYYTLLENPDTHIVGVKFKQGGAFHFFNMHQKDFSHQIINLHDVLNGESESLRDQLIVPQEPEDIKRILDHYMLIKVGHSNKSTNLVSSLMDKVQVTDSRTSIRDLSEHAHISHKHLITLFNQIVGLPPKLVHRLNKFTKVLDVIQNKEKVNWPQVAFECQYYDQAHLINEFKTFSGLSPRKYFNNENAQGLRVVMP